MKSIHLLHDYMKNIYRGAVIRYSPNSGVVPYFSEILPLYLIDAHFPKNSQNPVPYRHPFSKMRIFADFPKIVTFFPFKYYKYGFFKVCQFLCANKRKTEHY